MLWTSLSIVEPLSLSQMKSYREVTKDRFIEPTPPVCWGAPAKRGETGAVTQSSVYLSACLLYLSTYLYRRGVCLFVVLRVFWLPSFPRVRLVGVLRIALPNWVGASSFFAGTSRQPRLCVVLPYPLPSLYRQLWTSLIEGISYPVPTNMQLCLSYHTWSLARWWLGSEVGFQM